MESVRHMCLARLEDAEARSCLPDDDKISADVTADVLLFVDQFHSETGALALSYVSPAAFNVNTLFTSSNPLLEAVHSLSQMERTKSPLRPPHRRGRKRGRARPDLPRQAPLDHGPRARAVIWLPLQFARMRRERETVIAVLPARFRTSSGGKQCEL